MKLWPRCRRASSTRSKGSIGSSMTSRRSPLRRSSGNRWCRTFPSSTCTFTPSNSLLDGAIETARLRAREGLGPAGAAPPATMATCSVRSSSTILPKTRRGKRSGRRSARWRRARRSEKENGKRRLGPRRYFAPPAAGDGRGRPSQPRVPGLEGLPRRASTTSRASISTSCESERRPHRDVGRPFSGRAPSSGPARAALAPRGGVLRIFDGADHLDERHGIAGQGPRECRGRSRWRWDLRWPFRDQRRARSR